MKSLGESTQEAQLVPLLEALPDGRVTKQLVQSLVDNANKEKTVATILRQIRSGSNKNLGRANLTFSRRDWGFIKLKRETCTKFAESLHKGDSTKFLECLLLSIER